jgi:hypothetical protein
MKHWKGVEMHEIAGAQIGAPRRRNWIVLTAAALAVAVGLVAVGRFTAPTTKTVVAAIAAPAPCGTLAPAVAPSRACSQVIERAFGPGTVRSGDFVAAFAPATLPPRAAQRVLEAAFGGVLLNGNRP